MVAPPPVLPAASLSGSAARVVSMMEAEPPHVPFVLGGCGSGRTTMLCRIRDHYGSPSCQYIDVERAATTPERFLQAVISHSPFAPVTPAPQPATPREAFDRTLAFLASAQAADGRPAVFLLDEALEIRTFESFPGLRRAVPELLDSLVTTRNRFVLASRYEARALRLLRGRQPACVPVPAAALTNREIGDLLQCESPGEVPSDVIRAGGPGVGDLADVVRRLSDGRPAYAGAIASAMRATRSNGGGDPVSALTALLCPGGQLARRCERSYETRLHHARGYGALKAILDILSANEPLTLTEVSQQLHRTPGSTKDYLSWLEDVDLVGSRDKRYHIRDPILRLWVRLYCHPVPPGDEGVAQQVQRYALQRLSAGGGSAVDAPGRPAGRPRRATGAVRSS